MLGWVEVDCCCAVVAVAVAVDNVDMIARLMSTATL